MSQNEGNKRGRPQGAKNKIVKNLGILSKNAELSAKESKRLINLFIIKKLQKIDELCDQLSPTAQARLLTDLMKYSTTQADVDSKVAQSKKENKKQISEIKISYEKPQELPAPIDITPIEEGESDEAITNENIDVQIDYEDINDKSDFIEIDDESDDDNEPY